MGSTAAVRSDDAAPESPDSPTTKFAELRTLLVGPEQRQLHALQTRLDDPAVQAREVSRVLPAAVELRTNDPHLKRALGPTIEEAISSSVRRNPRPLADALFPIIGPAIRKAIAATLTGMLESLNTTLEHSFSWRSLRWRLDARRTGKSFAEIVLLNTLVYRVEQVFLVHTPSGLLLQHVTAPGAQVEDGNMVSGMLTAIREFMRDFMRDSFHVSSEAGLQTFQVGEHWVWIEQGPHALVAAVIRGNAPQDLRVVLQQALEGVHAQYFDLLQSFNGDATPFEGTRPLLEMCLQQQFRARHARGHFSPMLRFVSVVLVVALGLWLFFVIRARARWNAYLEALRSEPGIVVVSTGREDGKYTVSGLRDPLARDPASLLAAQNLSAADVVGRWEYYQALHPALVLARARQVLAAPAGTILAFDNGVLSAAGTAPVEWIDSTARIAPVLPGITRFDASAAIDNAAKTLASSIQAAAPLFVKGTVAFADGGEAVVQQQIARLRALDELGRVANRRFAVELVGEADSDGPPEANLPLSRERALRVLRMLPAQQFPRLKLTATGIGSRQAADESADEMSKQRNRRVSFRISTSS